VLHRAVFGAAGAGSRLNSFMEMECAFHVGDMG